MNEQQLNQFIERYISMWHEPDEARRGELVRALWAPDAENYTRTFVVRGLAEILPRVARAHQQWVVSKGCIFRPAGNTSTHNHLIKFFWEMLPKDGGAVEARGLDIFVLTASRQIQALYQFSEPT